jgi:hypothetical protein
MALCTRRIERPGRRNTSTVPTLPQFIRANIEPLAVEWEEVARLLTPDVHKLTQDELRDHVPDLLAAIDDDVDAHRTSSEQTQYARGRSTDFSPAITAYARQHAQTRLDHGFTLQGMAAEYRALRESVRFDLGRDMGQRERGRTPRPLLQFRRSALVCPANEG